MNSILRKELRVFLNTPSFYGVLFLCAALFSWRFLMSLYYFAQNYQNRVFQLGEANYSMHIHFGLFAAHLSYLNLVFILLIPAVTMKLFAEERSSGSLKLLLSSPLSHWQIVGGKFLAALTVMGLILILSFLFPLTCAFFADIDWVLLFGSYLGMFLLGMLYVAMGIFSSSLGSSTMVAFVLGVLLNVIAWFVGLNGEMVDAHWLRDLLSHLSLNHHISGMIQGVFRLSAVVFFVSLAFVFLFISEKLLSWLKWK